MFFCSTENLIFKKGETQMPQYMITYLGTPKSSSPEEDQKNMSKYRDWLSSLGDLW